MLRISVDVGNGVNRSRVSVQAESIRQALYLVQKRYPKSDIQLVFPLDPESFFVEELSARSGIVGVYKPVATAA
jgi:hypothetical protein